MFRFAHLITRWVAGSVFHMAVAALCTVAVVGGGTVAIVKGVQAPKAPSVGENAAAGTSALNNNASASGSAGANTNGQSAGASAGAGAAAPGVSASTSPSASVSLPATTIPSPTVSTPGSLLPTAIPTSLSVLPTPSLPAVVVPTPSLLPLPALTPLAGLGLPVYVTAGTNPLALFASGSYSVPVPSVAGHSADLCLGVDQAQSCQTLKTPSQGAMTLTLSFSGNTSVLPPTFTPLECTSGVGYSVTLAGATPGTSVSASASPGGGLVKGVPSTSKSVVASLCLS